MAYDLSKKEARKLADELEQKDNVKNTRLVTCSGYSVKFDVIVDGHFAEGAQIHGNKRTKSLKRQGD